MNFKLAEYRGRPYTGRAVCVEDPDVWVHIFSPDIYRQDSGWQLIVHVDGVSFGFKNALKASTAPDDRDANGELQLVIRYVCVPVGGSAVPIEDGNILARATKFSSRAQQDKVIKVLLEGTPAVLAAKRLAPKSIVLSPEAQNKIDRGDFLK